VEENAIGLRIFGDHMNNLQIFQVDIIDQPKYDTRLVLI
jgi:hypothetical protein